MQQKYKFKKILVTGGAGFIGSHLCEQLLTKGYAVTAIDNFSTGSKRNVMHLLANPLFTLIEHDVVNPLPEIKVDQIYCLASPAAPAYYQKHPIETLQANIYGVTHAAALAKKQKATIVFASTSEVYGDPAVHPQPETYNGNVNPVGPRACYDEAKRCAETLCVALREKENITIKIVRIFNTYGPRMDKQDGRVIPNFVTQTLADKPITIYGDGTQTRSLCYVSDLVDGLMHTMNTASAIGPINLGNPDEYTIKQLANTIVSLTKSKSEYQYLPLPTDDPLQRRPDITKAKNELGWSPKVPLQEGLQKTIAYFKA